MNDEEKEIVNETKQLLENLTGLAISERFNNKYAGFNFLINSRNVDILIKVIEKQQTKIKLLEDDLYSANDTIENILNELDRLQKENEELISDNLEYQRIQDIFDKRTYRKKYLEERRKETPNLLYPDSDEIYKRYYELKEENKKKSIEIICYQEELGNSIPKQVIRDKIKELSDNKDFDEDVYVEEYAVDVLKELLGDE